MKNSYFDQPNPYETEESWLSSMQSGGSSGGMEAAGAGAAMSGNPYAMAASGGLKVLEMVAKRKEKEREMKYQANLEHKDGIRSALDKLIGISQGLKNL